jgi:twitching motility protein PilT
MVLRDAEAIVLEAGKVPSLRRRGQIEALAMAALDAEMLAAFAAPLLAGRSLSEGVVQLPFDDADGTAYQLAIEQAASGLRIIARKGPAKPAAVAPTRAYVAPTASAAAAAVTAGRAEIAERSERTERAERAERVARADRDDRAEIAARIGALLQAPVAETRARGGSDVVLSTGQAPRMRIDGRVEALDLEIADAELAACVSALARADEPGVSADLSLEIDGGRVRLNAFDHLGGHAIAARLISDRVPTLAELGLPAELGAVIDQRDGLVLICGPTGAGKSTTMASLLDLLDQRRAVHVITIEDPIEYRFTSRRGIVHQRELGTHVASFADGLRAALREVPDVILIGELRDRETIAAALTAAETGHLVIATLHAPSAVGAIDRVIDAFPEGTQRQIRHQLAGSLRTVITQYLLPRRDGGRAPAIELVPVTSAVANIIRKGDLHTLQTAIQSGRDAGMIPLERSLAKLIDSGAVAPAEVRRIAADQDLLSALAGRLR